MFQHALSQENETDTTKAQLYVVTKHDGTEYIGYILSDDGREVLIETEALGKIYIPKSDIKSIVKVTNSKEIIHGEFQSQGPFTTRYYFTTNGHPIKKGENYALAHLYGPEVQFAISDHFSFGLMSTWAASPIVGAFKYSFNTKKENLNFSLGTLAGTSGYLNTFKGYGALHWANVTIGDRKKNLTISAGYGYLQTGLDQAILEDGTYYQFPEYTEKRQSLVHSPMFSIAGIIKVGARASFVFDSMFGYRVQREEEIRETLISEAYYDNVLGVWMPEIIRYDVSHFNNRHFGFFIMPGMRFQSTDRRAFQIALAGVAVIREKGSDYSFPFPMCTWFFKF